MTTYTCQQHGCPFSAESEPDFCPVCNNPYRKTEAIKSVEPLVPVPVEPPVNE